MNDKFSEYTFDDIDIGLSKQFQVTITESLVNNFINEVNYINVTIIYINMVFG